MSLISSCRRSPSESSVAIGICLRENVVGALFGTTTTKQDLCTQSRFKFIPVHDWRYGSGRRNRCAPVENCRASRHSTVTAALVRHRTCTVFREQRQEKEADS